MYVCMYIHVYMKSAGIIRRREENKEKWQEEERDGSTKGETEFEKFLLRWGRWDGWRYRLANRVCLDE